MDTIVKPELDDFTPEQIDQLVHDYFSCENCLTLQEHIDKYLDY